MRRNICHAVFLVSGLATHRHALNVGRPDFGAGKAKSGCYPLSLPSLFTWGIIHRETLTHMKLPYTELDRWFIKGSSDWLRLSKVSGTSSTA